MDKLTRAKLAIQKLEACYPDAECSLTPKDPFRLLVAVRLSAQCTDARVNIVCEDLFEKFKTPEDFAYGDIEKLEKIVYPCGFYKVKSKDLMNMSRRLIEHYNGVVPDTIEELLTLPGVGRKSANLIVGDIYGKPAIVCDTHCIRIANRLGLIDTKDPTKAEMALRKIIPPFDGMMFCHRLVWHGRAVCDARRPLCDNCCLFEICERNGIKQDDRKK